MESDLVPPGLTYLADNIITRQNILGVSKEQGAHWAHHLNLPAQGETFSSPAAATSFRRSWKY